MADPKDLAERLRGLARGRTEWRVQHPVERSYCMSFDHADCINPEWSARAWLREFQQRFPDHPHAKYEVAEVRYFSELERVAREAADALDPPGVGVADGNTSRVSLTDGSEKEADRG